MKMSPEKAQQLSRLVFWSRVRSIAAVAGIFIVVAIPIVSIMELRLARTDAAVDVHQIEGTVIEAHPTGSGRGAVVKVHLADGRDVDAISSLRLAIIGGTHVVVLDTVHVSGRHSYGIKNIVR